MILLDRSIDPISPFLIQQNYEGQIDETFGIESSYTEVQNRIINPSATESENRDPEGKELLRLTNENDHIFKEIRNLTLSQLGSVTSRKLQEIQDIIGKKEAKMSIKEMTNYMADIKKMDVARSKQHIDKHVNVAMEIKERQKTIDYMQCYRMEHNII